MKNYYKRKGKEYHRSSYSKLFNEEFIKDWIKAKEPLKSSYIPQTPYSLKADSHISRDPVYINEYINENGDLIEVKVKKEEHEK